jgi:hypothetical protein
MEILNYEVDAILICYCCLQFQSISAVFFRSNLAMDPILHTLIYSFTEYARCEGWKFVPGKGGDCIAG